MGLVVDGVGVVTLFSVFRWRTTSQGGLRARTIHNARGRGMFLGRGG